MKIIAILPICTSYLERFSRNMQDYSKQKTIKKTAVYKSIGKNFLRRYSRIFILFFKRNPKNVINYSVEISFYMHLSIYYVSSNHMCVMLVHFLESPMENHFRFNCKDLQTYLLIENTNDVFQAHIQTVI